MYKWAKIAADATESWLYEDDRKSDIRCLDEMRLVEQFEILDPEGDQIAIVLSQVEAEALVSHLNR